jgi:hypothetical protein
MGCQSNEAKLASFSKENYEHEWSMLLKFSRQLTLSQAHARTSAVFVDEFNASTF